MEKHNFKIHLNSKEINSTIIIDNNHYSIPSSVFIFEDKDNNEYIVYETDDRGYIEIGMSFDNKQEAIIEAEEWYINLVESINNDCKTKVLKGGKQ